LGRRIVFPEISPRIVKPYNKSQDKSARVLKELSMNKCSAKHF